LRHLGVSGNQGDDGLFEMNRGEPPVVELGPVDKTFRPFQPDQTFLVPPSLDEWLPQSHLAGFIADLVDEHLDLSAFYADCREGRGAPPLVPQAGGGVLGPGGVPLAGRRAGAGVSDDREVPQAAPVRVGASVRAGPGVVPGRRDGQPRQVALDGTKVRANASRRKAMSYARMSEKQKILAAEVSELLAEAERIDKDEDAKFGKDNKGYGLPDELARREGRLAKIAEAKAALEAEAAERAATEAAERARAAGKDEDTIAERAAAAADRAVPKPRAQRNFTDPESRIMKTADGSFAQCFNAQAVVERRPSGDHRDGPEELRR
jgi:hypothetical protein